MLPKLVAKALRECHVPHEGEPEVISFRQGTGDGIGNLRMDVVTACGTLLICSLPGKTEYQV